MAKKDLFEKPFDDGTLHKLQVFEDYFKEWLPVFISRKEIIWNKIQIFDFFAGEGKDVKGIDGSPLRILRILNQNKAQILQSKIKINVVINEFDKEKYDLLVDNINLIADRSVYDLDVTNKDFSVVFSNYHESMKQTANFLFLDQNGIKQITENIFSKLIELKQTDFLFFISSSFINRFSELDEFRKYINISKEELEGQSYYHIHRLVLSYYRSMIPNTKEYFLAPFSIKKPAGIYGLIFGTNHTLGIEKFLHVCWKHDKLRGEANYDIDKEGINVNQPGLFPEFNVPSKKQVFSESLRNKILSIELKSDRDIYLYTLNEGFLLKDANQILKELVKEGKISYSFNIISSDLHKIKEHSLINVK